VAHTPEDLRKNLQVDPRVAGRRGCNIPPLQEAG